MKEALIETRYFPTILTVVADNTATAQTFAAVEAMYCIMHCVCRRVSFETTESPVTAMDHLSIEGNAVIIATQWKKNVRLWAVSSQGFLTPCGSVDGQVLFYVFYIL